MAVAIDEHSCISAGKGWVLLCCFVQLKAAAMARTAAHCWASERVVHITELLFDTIESYYTTLCEVDSCFMGPCMDKGSCKTRYRDVHATFYIMIYPCSHDF